MGQFLVFCAFGVALTAVTNDHINVVGRNIATTHVAEIIIVFAVERTYRCIRHAFILADHSLLCQLAMSVPY